MSKFKVGDKVRVTQVTDIDSDYPRTVHTDPTHEYTMDWQDPPQTLIGQVGELYEVDSCDYYDVQIKFPWNAEREFCSFLSADLELVTE